MDEKSFSVISLVVFIFLCFRRKKLGASVTDSINVPLEKLIPSPFLQKL